MREEDYPEFDVEIEGPSLATTISWREGKLFLQNWRADIEASFLSGNFEARGTKGRLKVQAVDANLKISDLVGLSMLKVKKVASNLKTCKAQLCSIG